MRIGVALAAAAVAIVCAPGAARAEPAHVGPPSSLAALGDSITRGFNTGWFPFVDWPASSWSSGTDPAVGSHYSRLLALNPAIAGHGFNDAATGADSADLSTQAQLAVSQRVEYVTVLIGANDACAASEAGMTPVATFGARVAAALAALAAGLPDARIYVVSVPDLYHLWSLVKDNLAAQLVWGIASICQSLLADPWSNDAADVDRRLRVRQRTVDYNDRLRAACALFVHCRYDDDAAFETRFAAADVSNRDYFHPSLSGQATAAAATWAAGFDFTDVVAPRSRAWVAPAPLGSRVRLTAVDAAGVSGIEYRLGAGAWQRYAGALTVAAGARLTWRAVDRNGNMEATRSLVGRPRRAATSRAAGTAASPRPSRRTPASS
jgi:lysophospholipase L1-like esterase